MAGTASAWMLLIVAGSANATFGLPMKYVRGWEWENTWALWSLLALIVFPAALAIACVPSLAAVYREAGSATTGTVFLLGAAWGLAQVLFGKAMDAIGIGLTFSIVLGLSAAAGTVLPMLRMGLGSVGSGASAWIAAGLLLVLLGVATCAQAGRRREQARAEATTRSSSFLPGLIMALCSGLLASFMNVGIAFGTPLAARASTHGSSEANSVYAIWLPLLVGGAVPNLLYCAYLFSHRRTWRQYREASLALNILLAGAMAALWFFSTALYGVASHRLGEWGVVLGWPVFMSVIVIGAGLLGVASGEWKESGITPVLLQLVGILLLVIAIISFSRAQNSMQPAPSKNAAALSLPEPSSGGIYVR